MIPLDQPRQLINNNQRTLMSTSLHPIFVSCYSKYKTIKKTMKESHKYLKLLNRIQNIFVK